MMEINSYATKPAEPSMLVNIPKLVTAYYSAAQIVSEEHR